MQQLLKWIRHLLYPAALILLVWAAYKVIASPYTSESKGNILVVYNGDSAGEQCKNLMVDMENESQEALAGLCEAEKNQGGPAVDLLTIGARDRDRSDMDASKVYQQLATQIAGGTVLGVISLLPSPDSVPIVRFCRTMGIPLLLAIAANDDLMGPAEDTAGIVFRMVPTNGMQAKNIATWIGEQVPHSGPLRVAVFHEPNSFGEFLERHLTLELKQQLKEREKVLTFQFEVNDHLEFTDLLPQLWCENLDAVVYLGFAPRATDLLNKLIWFRADKDQIRCRSKDDVRSFDNLSVVLASAAYREDLNDPAEYPFPFRVFAMLPTQSTKTNEPGAAANEGNPDHQAQVRPVTFSDYGYDSYNLMKLLAAQNQRKGGGNDLFKILSQRSDHTKTGHTYVFGPSGELSPEAENMYQAYRLRSSETKKAINP